MIVLLEIPFKLIIYVYWDFQVISKVKEPHEALCKSSAQDNCITKSMEHITNRIAPYKYAPMCDKKGSITILWSGCKSK